MHISISRRILTPKGLSAVIYTIAQQPSLWTDLVQFRQERRYWVQLEAPEVFRDSIDLWLLTWLPGQETEPHDHGGAGAAFRVLRGSLTEVRWSRDGGSTTSLRSAGASTEVPADAIHDVFNAGDEPAVSLHAYSPRLTTMRYYRRTEAGMEAFRLVETNNPESEWVR